MSAKIKMPQFAGSFYDKNPEKLKQAIEQHMEAGFKVSAKPKAIIAPHAGYIYSGDIAGSAYSPLASMRDQIKLVVMLGPAHKVPVQSFALPESDRFATPLGEVEIAQDIVKQLVDKKIAPIQEAAFAKEHSLEVQIPFLQHHLKNFKLLPILVGHPPIEQITALLKALYGDSSILIVISSDLSHYLTYNEANQIDMLTSQQISALDYQAIGDDQACGRYPVKGMLALAKALGLTVRTIDLRNSGDTQGNKDRVVGYGAYHCYEPNEALGFYSKAQKDYLKKIAKESIMNGFQKNTFTLPDPKNSPFQFAAKKASFVTLEKQGKLRGCIGSLQAHQTLIDDIAINAYKSAFTDKRFPPLDELECPEISIAISILSDPTPIQFESESDLIDQLRRTIDGLIISDQGCRAVFLPSVWESIKEPKVFLRQLKAKAGFAPDHWSDTFEAYRFTADKI